MSILSNVSRNGILFDRVITFFKQKKKQKTVSIQPQRKLSSLSPLDVTDNADSAS